MNGLLLKTQAVVLATTGIDVDAIIDVIMGLFNELFIPGVMCVVTIIFSYSIVKNFIALNRSEDEGQRIEAKKKIKNSFIALAGCFLGLIIFYIVLPQLQEWLGGYMQA